MVFLILLCYLLSNDYVSWKRSYREACAASWILGVAVAEFSIEMLVAIQWLFNT